MRKFTRAIAAASLLSAATAAQATPSTTFWTPATTYTQPYLVPHLTYDTYVGEQGLIPNDYGLTIGVLPFEKLQGEIGVDVFYPGYTESSLYLNAKLTLPENAFGAWQPGLSVGIQSFGFEKDVSDYGHLHVTVGKTFAGIGSVAVGAYYGMNENLYVGSDGKTNRSGFMASYVSPDVTVGLPGLQKVVFLADYASGKNGFGGYGGGVGLYFTPAIALLTGPVWLVDSDAAKAAYGSSFLWTVQVDVDVELMGK